MALYLAASPTCAIREDAGQFIFINPSSPGEQAVGTWSDAVALAIRILTHEAVNNGGIPGMIFCAADHYAQGIENGTITAHDEIFGQQIVALIAQLKAQ